jgi:hypothetical protein
MNFGVRNFAMRRNERKNTLIFEHYNLMDPMEVGAITF